MTKWARKYSYTEIVWWSLFYKVKLSIRGFVTMWVMMITQQMCFVCCCFRLLEHEGILRFHIEEPNQVYLRFLFTAHHFFTLLKFLAAWGNSFPFFYFHDTKITMQEGHHHVHISPEEGWRNQRRRKESGEVSTYWLHFTYSRPATTKQKRYLHEFS